MEQCESVPMHFAASPDLVFAFLTDPELVLRLTRRAAEVRVINIIRKPDGGYRYEAEHNLMGFSVRSQFETTLLNPMDVIEVQSRGDIDSSARWELYPGAQGGTDATLTFCYSLNGNLLTRVSMAVLQASMRNVLSQIASHAEGMIVEP